MAGWWGVWRLKFFYHPTPYHPTTSSKPKNRDKRISPQFSEASKTPHKNHFRLVWAIYGDFMAKWHESPFSGGKKASMWINASWIDRRMRYIRPNSTNYGSFLFVSSLWIEWAILRLTTTGLTKVMSKNRKSMSNSNPSGWLCCLLYPHEPP